MFHIGDTGEEWGRSERYSINDISPTQALVLPGYLASIKFDVTTSDVWLLVGGASGEDQTEFR